MATCGIFQLVGVKESMSSANSDITKERGDWPDISKRKYGDDMRGPRSLTKKTVNQVKMAKYLACSDDLIAFSVPAWPCIRATRLWTCQ